MEESVFDHLAKLICADPFHRLNLGILHFNFRKRNTAIQNININKVISALIGCEKLKLIGVGGYAELLKKLTPNCRRLLPIYPEEC